ncbi:MAG: hypothetical protein GY928_33755 [Colwellia sp.]|nr:hypothetical protein [Colwellia sp.]
MYLGNSIFEEVKSRINLEDYVASDLGEPQEKGGNWWSWVCPFHTEKTASFKVNVNTQSWCCFGACAESGDIIDYYQGRFAGAIEPIEAAKKLLGIDGDSFLSNNNKEYAKKAHKQKQLTVAEKRAQLNSSGRLEKYCEMFWYESNREVREWCFNKWGLDENDAAKFSLGLCPKSPLSFPHYSASLTVPYTWKDYLLTIRHRLFEPNGRGKYLPDMTGLGSAMFGADILLKPLDDVVIVEGGIKVIILRKNGINAVGIPGAQFIGKFKKDTPKSWARLFGKVKTSYIALDPGMEEQAAKLCEHLNQSGNTTRHVMMACKPDDFFVQFGGNESQFKMLMAQAIY